MFNCDKKNQDYFNFQKLIKTNLGDCKDIKSTGSCEYWKGKGYCTRRFVSYMKKNCAKTCGHCQDSK